jgi:hypothetical protein
MSVHRKLSSLILIDLNSVLSTVYETIRIGSTTILSMFNISISQI